MLRLSFAALALIISLAVGCAYHRDQTEYQRTETIRSEEPGDQSRQSETVTTHRERTVIEETRD